MTTAAEVLQVLIDQPDLGLFGFGERTPIDITDEFTAQVDASRDWLRNAPGRWRAIQRCSTYGLKHLVEERCGHYVPVSAATVAARLEGFDLVRAWHDGPNCRLKNTQHARRLRMAASA